MPEGQENLDLTRKGDTPSKVDLFTGKHTSSIIVAILFTITLASLIVVVCVKDSPPENLITGLVGLLGVLAGFFAGTNFRKDE